jgi:hypothetical protein
VPGALVLKEVVVINDKHGSDEAMAPLYMSGKPLGVGVNCCDFPQVVESPSLRAAGTGHRAAEWIWGELQKVAL